MLTEHRHLLDWLTWACAGLSGLSAWQSLQSYGFWQNVALAIAILSGLASLLLFGIKLHDRFRYGSWNGPGR